MALDPDRVDIPHHGGQMRIVMRGHRHWDYIAWYGLNLLLAAGLFFFLLGILFAQRQLPGPFIYAIVLMLVTCFMTLYLIIWQLMGQEIVNLDSQGLHYTRSLRGWGRTRVYAQKHIAAIRPRAPQSRFLVPPPAY